MSAIMSEIEQCQWLVIQLGFVYKDKDRTTFLDNNPTKLIEISTMALWAHSLSGPIKLDLGLPSVKIWLKNIAANGPGYVGTYKDVMYKFVKRQSTSDYFEGPYLMIRRGAERQNDHIDIKPGVSGEREIRIE